MSPIKQTWIHVAPAANFAMAAIFVETLVPLWLSELTLWVFSPPIDDKTHLTIRLHLL